LGSISPQSHQKLDLAAQTRHITAMTATFSKGGLVMPKAPFLGPVLAAMLLAGATSSLAAPTPGRGSTTHGGQPSGSMDGLDAWDGQRLDPAGVTVGGEGDMGSGPTPPAWDERATGQDHYGADGATTNGEFAGASKLANLGPVAESDALPLSQFAGAHAKPGPGHGVDGVWDIVNRVRYGRLPEPASWALMLIGFGMIGAALRGFVVANRRLARLQPEDGE
jgi:hypothetical protein